MVPAGTKYALQNYIYEESQRGLWSVNVLQTWKWFAMRANGSLLEVPFIYFPSPIPGVCFKWGYDHWPINLMFWQEWKRELSHLNPATWRGGYECITLEIVSYGRSLIYYIWIFFKSTVGICAPWHEKYVTYISMDPDIFHSCFTRIFNFVSNWLSSAKLHQFSYNSDC